MTLLLCPVRPGENIELRYALRSWETNLHLPGGLELWTVGDHPDWCTPDRHIPGNLYKSVPLAVFDNVRIGATYAAAHDEVVYMNDDFFCLDPVGSVLPVKRNCSLAEHIAMFPENAGTWWPASLRLTAQWLASEGWDHPDSYEVHRPLVANPSLMEEALGRWLAHLPYHQQVPQWRTIYGVLNEVEAYPVSDVKLGRLTTGVGTPWVSTSDQSWRIYGRDIMRRFQKPSRWERA